jgi:hypothetical protein
VGDARGHRQGNRIPQYQGEAAELRLLSVSASTCVRRLIREE